MNHKKTPRVAPAGLLQRKIGPDKPLQSGDSAGLAPYRENQPLPAEVTQAITPTPVDSDYALNQEQQVRLLTEAAEAQQLHANVVDSLPDSSALKYAGQILNTVIQGMTPGGVAILFPVLENFRQHATTITDSSSSATLTVDPITAATNAVPVRDILDYVASMPASQRKYLKSATDLLIAREQASSSKTLRVDFTLMQDLLRGYGTMTNSLGVLSEQIATYGPRVWGEIGRDMQTPGLEGLASSISDLSTEVWQAYTATNANVLSTHAALASSSTKRQSTVTKLSTLSSTAHAVSQAIRILDDPNSVADLDAIEKQLKDQLSSFVKASVNNFLKKVENQLKNSLTRKVRPNVNDSKAAILKILQSSSS